MSQKPQMRLLFNDVDLKDKLMVLAEKLDISMNSLVNMILEAHFSDTEFKRLKLFIEIAEFQKEVVS